MSTYTKRQAKIDAEEIGRDLADNGRASVMPWVKCYSWWPEIRRALGHDEAVKAAHDAFEIRRSEREGF